MASIVTLKGLGFRYPNAEGWVTRNLTLEIEAGEFVAIVGGSGVGKSTILRIIAGLIQPQQGSVAISGAAGPGTRRRALVFQDGRLMPWRTVRENVRLGLERLNLAGEEIESRIGEVLSLTGLSEFADRWPHQLSGGQAQRVGIARALAVKPSILLMDEPFSAVDAITRHKLQSELARIWAQSGAAVAFVTHDIEEAVYLADRIVVLRGTPAQITNETIVQIERPRSRKSPRLYELSAEIASFLEEE